jgi:hypothetical protein
MSEPMPSDLPEVKGVEVPDLGTADQTPEPDLDEYEVD